MKKALQMGGIVVAIVVAMVVIEYAMGRSVFGPSGKPGFWVGSITDVQCSQGFADPYAFSHIAHGLIFFFLLWVFARKLPIRHRFLIAVLIEAGWEILENSPIIINRYRDATIALGYTGDSIFNSVSDLAMMSLGFLFAWRMPVWASVVLILVMEIGCALWVRDNLTMNVIMLIYPIEALKTWQMGGQ